jgi:hypothetical protein
MQDSIAGLGVLQAGVCIWCVCVCVRVAGGINPTHARTNTAGVAWRCCGYHDQLSLGVRACVRVGLMGCSWPHTPAQA